MQRIAVIGGGTMGAGIAEVSARAGCDVVVVEADPAGVERFRARLEKSLQRAATSGRLSQEDGCFSQSLVHGQHGFQLAECIGGQ